MQQIRVLFLLKMVSVVLTGNMFLVTEFLNQWFCCTYFRLKCWLQKAQRGGLLDAVGL